jgi:hypothetical protein
VGVELADQGEEAGSGRLDVCRQLGDLVAQPVPLLDALRDGKQLVRMEFHGESSLYLG